MSIKTEKIFDGLVEEPIIGKPAIIRANGLVMKTSPVKDYMMWSNGDITIKTKNSIYRGTDVIKYY